MNIGVFGGAFNPPHLGHLIVAETVREQLRLDTVLFVPSGDPPHRQDVGRGTAEERLEMTRRAIRGNSSFDLSDVELRRPGKSYTIDTLTALEAIYSGTRLYLLIGSDNLAEFHTWKSPREILTKCELVVFPRPGFSLHDIKNDFARAATVVNVPAIELSGNEIRRKVRSGRSIHYMVPAGVEEYIARNQLYVE